MAVTYDVYFGETGSMVLVSEGQAATSFSLSDYSPLDYGTEYSWRIDSINEGGTTTGDVWTFTTLTLLPPGEGSSISYRRLIAAANGKIWYEEI